MTLINYLNRVHLAENVLEEALWAELDERREVRLCIISTHDILNGELGERLRAGLPRQISTTVCPTPGALPTEFEARRVSQFYTAQSCDAILAVGRGYVINLAKAVRLLVSHDTPLAKFAEEEGGTFLIGKTLPDLIAVPTLQGFSAGFNGLLSILLNQGQMIDIASRHLVPTVTIGDPTLAINEPAEIQASAAVDAITLCVEALVSPNYNPPATGIALDGLHRGMRSLKTVSAPPDVGNRRELMAANMNAALVQQKGQGLAHAMTSSLCASCRGQIDKGSVKRLLLPAILDHCNDCDALDGTPLADALGVGSPAEAARTLRLALGALPLSASLSEMQLTPEHLAEAADRTASHRALSNSPCRPTAAEILNIYHSVY